MQYFAVVDAQPLPSDKDYISQAEGYMSSVSWQAFLVGPLDVKPCQRCQIQSCLVAAKVFHLNLRSGQS
jgi:hypothetical protein